jgi:phytoene/squalene synthetase
VVPEPRWRPGVLQGALGVAEQVAACDLDNLYRVSCYFEDLERYRAFCAQYAVMRVLDDRIDAIPSRAALSDRERLQGHDAVDAWMAIVDRAYMGEPQVDGVLAAAHHPQCRALAEAFATSLTHFRVPPQLWRDFFDAMHRDIERPRFGTYEEFVSYSQGAAVAPTTIYLHLLTAEPEAEHARYQPVPGFDLVAAGRSLGLFAYVGHILRDLAEDLRTGSEGLLSVRHDLPRTRDRMVKRRGSTHSKCVRD